MRPKRWTFRPRPQESDRAALVRKLEWEHRSAMMALASALADLRPHSAPDHTVGAVIPDPERDARGLYERDKATHRPLSPILRVRLIQRVPPLASPDDYQATAQALNALVWNLHRARVRLDAVRARAKALGHRLA